MTRFFFKTMMTRILKQEKCKASTVPAGRLSHWLIHRQVTEKIKYHLMTY